MPESLPGDPTEAGPDTRKRNASEQSWHDLEADAIGELQFAMHNHGFRTLLDIRMQRVAITDAINLLMDADSILQRMEATRAR